MEETKFGIEITKGIKGAIQDLVVPEVRAIVNELKHHTKVLDRHEGKLENISEYLHLLDKKMDSILVEFELGERVRNLEEATRALPNILKNQEESKEAILQLIAKIGKRRLE